MRDFTKSGWVRIHRKISENGLWFLEPFTKAQAWIDLFLNANHKDGVIQIRGNIIPIKRGQIGWSELTMCKRWMWSKNRTRKYLKWLEAEQQIIQQKDRYITTIITIINYEKYQSDTADDTAERQQTIHKQERKELNNILSPSAMKNKLMKQRNENDFSDTYETKIDVDGVEVKEAPEPKKDFTWSFEAEMNKMKKSGKKTDQILRLYWLKMRWVFHSKGELVNQLKRSFRTAEKIAEANYSGEELVRGINYCRNKFEDKWTLETVLKYLPEALKHD